jgi:glycosyltransferase involved in cell wall biosynthesis
MAHAERSAPSVVALSRRGGATDHVKVLLVSHTDGIAGAERILLEIVAYLRDTRFEPVVTVTGEGLLKRELEALGAKVYIRPVERWIPYKPFHTRWHLRRYLETLSARVRGIVGVIEREQVAIVHSNVGGALEGALAARLTGRPHVWHQHSTYRGDPDRGPWIPYGLYGYIFHVLADVNLCCCRFTADDLFARHLRRTVRILYNGVNVEALAPGPPERDIRPELGLGARTPLLGLLGTVYERKGQLQFVEAAARVHRAFPEAHFVLAGEKFGSGEYLGRILRRAAELGIADRVHYLGYRSDYVNVIKSLDIYVLASTLDMLPLVVLEAMACGKPVVATRSGGVAEAVVDGVTGRLVDVGDAAQMAEALGELLSRPDRAAVMGTRARERAVALFDSRSWPQKLPGIYDELLHRRHFALRWSRRPSAWAISAMLAMCNLSIHAYTRIRG